MCDAVEKDSLRVRVPVLGRGDRENGLQESTNVSVVGR
jgi:hypothetical protein